MPTLAACVLQWRHMLVTHLRSVQAAVAVVQTSGKRPHGFQVSRDFEGFSGHSQSYKLDVAKAMLEIIAATSSKVLQMCASTSREANQDLNLIAADLKELAMLAVPLGIKIAH